MNVCSYSPIRPFNNADIDARFRLLFKSVCFLQGSSGGGTVQSVVAGTGITVDATDPANPIVAATGGAPAISALTAATGNNTLSLGAFRQQWNPSGVGNILGSISMVHSLTTIANNHKNIYITMAGAHATSGISSWGLWLENNHTGTGSINTGIIVSVSGATTNTGIHGIGTQVGIRGNADITGIAGWFDKGRIETGSATFNSGRIDFKGLTSGTAIVTCSAVAGTPTLTLPTTTGTLALVGSTWGLTGNAVGATGKFIGSTDNFYWSLYSNNTEAMRIGAAQNIQIGSFNNTVNSTGSLFVGNINTLDFQSLAVGALNTGAGVYNALFGVSNSTFGTSGFAANKGNYVVGNESAAFGESNFTRAAHEFSCGYFGTDYTAAGDLTDRLFNIGASQDGGTTPANALTVLRNRNMGLAGVNTPTAKLHIAAGTATAGTAPIKFNAGTLLTTPELGTLEFTDDGTTSHLYITVRIATVVTRVQIV